jgi:hypothetical protein
VRRTSMALVLLTMLVAACGSGGATTTVQSSSTPPSGTQTLATQTATQAAASSTGAAASTTSSAASSAASGPTACSLITQAEASAALGDTVAPGVAPVAGENTCVFSGPVLKLTSVQIAIIGAAEFTPDQQSVPSSFTVTPATGIGDAAYYKKLFLPNAGGEFLMELSVKKGPVMFTITILDHSAADAPLMAGEKTLALAALGRI